MVPVWMERDVLKRSVVRSADDAIVQWCSPTRVSCSGRVSLDGGHRLAERSTSMTCALWVAEGLGGPGLVSLVSNTLAALVSVVISLTCTRSRGGEIVLW